VESIVGSRIEGDGIHYYRVKWKGYPETENTWEPKLNLSNCKDLVAKYEDGRPKRRKRESKT